MNNVDCEFFFLLLFTAVSLSLSETWYCFREKFFLFFFFIKILICLPSSSFDFVLLNVRSTSSLSFERERSCGGLYAAASSHDNTRYKPIGRKKGLLNISDFSRPRQIGFKTDEILLSFFLSFFLLLPISKQISTVSSSGKKR